VVDGAVSEATEQAGATAKAAAKVTTQDVGVPVPAVTRPAKSEPTIAGAVPQVAPRLGVAEWPVAPPINQARSCVRVA
jgi:hypothetical protein